MKYRIILVLFNPEIESNFGMLHYKKKANKYRRKAHFQPGDLVWLHLRKERFPSQRKNKLMPRADGTFEVSRELAKMLIRLIFLENMEFRQLLI